MMRILLLAIAAVALLTGSPMAADNNAGLQDPSCGGREAIHHNYEDWLSGFLAGAGLVGSPGGIAPLNGLNGRTIRDWVYNYCQAHPLEVIANAGEVFMAAHRLAPAPKAATAQTSPNVAVAVCESQITDAYHLIDSNSGQSPAAITALQDMHCKGSAAACNLGANQRRSQINTNELGKSEKTRMVLQTVGCFQLLANRWPYRRRWLQHRSISRWPNPASDGAATMGLRRNKCVG
jgi:hypothetical protein